LAWACALFAFRSFQRDRCGQLLGCFRPHRCKEKIYSKLFKADILREDEIDEENPEELKKILQERLDQFKKGPLLKIQQLLLELK
jgi:hypothetical protein